jgi:AraC family transcriptional regulator
LDELKVIVSRSIEWRADRIALARVVHDRGRVNDAHAHETACLMLMLDGEYSETAGLRSYDYDPFTAVYHPPGLDHRDVIGSSGVRLLVFEFAADLLEKPSRSRRDVSGSRAAWEMLALFRDMTADHDPLEFESRALEIASRTAGDPPARDLPSLDRAREYLHTAFRNPIAMRDVAHAAGLHPVYLGQSFRRQFGETIAHYVNRLRVRAAAEQLGKTDATLAAIAYEQGFCDQSHFQRVFKKFSGYTPAEFRASFS